MGPSWKEGEIRLEVDKYRWTQVHSASTGIRRDLFERVSLIFLRISFFIVLNKNVLVQGTVKYITTIPLHSYNPTPPLPQITYVLKLIVDMGGPLRVFLQGRTPYGQSYKGGLFLQPCLCLFVRPPWQDYPSLPWLGRSTLAVPPFLTKGTGWSYVDLRSYKLLTAGTNPINLHLWTNLQMQPKAWKQTNFWPCYTQRNMVTVHGLANISRNRDAPRHSVVRNKSIRLKKFIKDVVIKSLQCRTLLNTDIFLGCVNNFKFFNFAGQVGWNFFYCKYGFKWESGTV